MARGIVTTKPGGTGGSANGKLLVTDGTDSSGGSTGGVSSGTISGVGAGSLSAAVNIYPGAVVDFSDIGSASVGDIVDFVIGTDGMAAKITVFKPGIVITGVHKGNISVAAGTSLLVTAGKIDGKIEVNGGVLAFVENSDIQDDIKTVTDGSFVFIDSSRVEGKVKVFGASYLSVRNSKVEDKLVSKENIFASVVGCKINDNLEVLNAKTCSCSGNTVGGKTNTPGCTA